MGQGELHHPGSTCLVATQTHRVGLSKKDPRRVAREKRTLQIHANPSARLKLVALKANYTQGMEEENQKQGRARASQRPGWPGLGTRWGLAVSSQTPSYLLPESASGGSPERQDAAGLTVMPQFPRSLLPPRTTLREKGSCCHP